MIKLKNVLAPSASQGTGGRNEMTAKTSSNNTSGKEKKVLAAYFSHSGNTRVIANQIHESVGGDIFEIVAINSYPHNYNEVVEQARKELSQKFRPELKTKVANMEPYNMVFVGYPNWWGTIPMPVATFLSEYDFSGKTIVPFCTNEGSGLGRSVSDIKDLCTRSTILDGLAVRGSGVKQAQNEVSEWLHRIGMKK